MLDSRLMNPINPTTGESPERQPDCKLHCLEPVLGPKAYRMFHGAARAWASQDELVVRTDPPTFFSAVERPEQRLLVVDHTFVGPGLGAADRVRRTGRCQLETCATQILRERLSNDRFALTPQAETKPARHHNRFVVPHTTLNIRLRHRHDTPSRAARVSSTIQPRA